MLIKIRPLTKSVAMGITQHELNFNLAVLFYIVLQIFIWFKLSLKMDDYKGFKLMKKVEYQVFMGF